MKKLTYKFSNSSVDYYFAGGLSHLKELVDKDNAVIITDENVYNAHTKRFKNWNCIVLKPGEEYKIQSTVDELIDQLSVFHYKAILQSDTIKTKWLPFNKFIFLIGTRPLRNIPYFIKCLVAQKQRKLYIRQ